MPALAVVSRSTDHDADDLDLVAAVRAGDDRAFELLYVRYQSRITAYVRGMVHDHGRAEDITQEVFMSALRRMRGTDAAIAFKPWIYEIAKNACIDAWRRTRNVNEVSFDAKDALGADDHGRLADPRMTPDSAVDNKDAIDNLCGAFGGLSPTHHEILVMREFEGLSYREIGERLGMSRPGVESTLFRARKRLSEEYEELVSGERCLRVQRIVDSPGGRASGVRDQRRMARHLAHCQPCRRYARLAGVDLDTPVRPAAAAAAKIAAWVPLPLFLRRRWGGEELVSQSHHGPLTQWSATLAGNVDPGVVSGWSKAVATAATVAVAGVGAGAAVHEHRAIERFVGGSPPAAQHARPHGAGAATPASAQRARPHRSGAAAPAADAPQGSRAADPKAGGAGVPAGPSVSSSPGPGGTPAGGRGSPKPAAPAGRGAAGAGSVLPSLPDRPIAAAPTDVPAVPQAPPLGRVLDGLGSGSGSGATGATGATGAASDPAAAPAQTAVGSILNQATGLVGGTLPAPATDAPAAAAKPAAVTPPPGVVSTATGVLATVSTTVTGTLATTLAGRTAP